MGTSGGEADQAEMGRGRRGEEATLAKSHLCLSSSKWRGRRGSSRGAVGDCAQWHAPAELAQRAFWKQLRYVSCLPSQAVTRLPNSLSALPRLWRLFQSLGIRRHVSGGARAQRRFLLCFPGQMARLPLSWVSPDLVSLPSGCKTFFFLRPLTAPYSFTAHRWNHSDTLWGQGAMGITSGEARCTAPGK